MTVNDLHDIMHSSYKENDSSETAMLHMHNNILTALDQKKAVLIIFMTLVPHFTHI